MSSKPVIQRAAEATDKWIEKNGEAVASFHKKHLDVEAELMKLQVKLYNDYYAARKAEVSKIPHFWFGALIKDSQSSIFCSSAQDQEALTYLEDISVVRGQEGKHIEEFDLIFTFKENPFFSNTTLTKSYSLKDDEELIGNVETINWKDDAHNLVKSSPRKTDDDDDDSPDGLEPGTFFTLFTESEDPFNLGIILRDEFLPNAFEYFAGLVDDEEDDEDDFEDDEEDEDLSFDVRPTKKSKSG